MPTPTPAPNVPRLTYLRVVVLLDGDGICARRKASLEEKAAKAGLPYQNHGRP